AGRSPAKSPCGAGEGVVSEAVILSATTDPLCPTSNHTGTLMRVHKLVAAAVTVVGASLILAAKPVSPPGTVTGFNISADPRSYRGSCRAKIGWKATIHVSTPPVQVEYRWERSDGAKSAPRKITISDKTAEVTETWQL